MGPPSEQIFTVSNMCSLTMHGKPDGSSGSCRIWYWMRGIMDMILSAFSR